MADENPTLVSRMLINNAALISIMLISMRLTCLGAKKPQNETDKSTIHRRDGPSQYSHKGQLSLYHVQHGRNRPESMLPGPTAMESEGGGRHRAIYVQFPLGVMSISSPPLQKETGSTVTKNGGLLHGRTHQALEGGDPWQPPRTHPSQQQNK